MTSVKEELPDLKAEAKFPSFSIVYETENLSSVELENVYRSLNSLAVQDVSPEEANEFLIIDSGDAPPDVIEQLCSMYPWITVRKVPEMEYYEAKMTGASLVTGDVIVFCDSDCEYEPQWLREVLTLFQQHSDINIVAGETSTQIRNSYELAIAAHYFFPRFSNQKQPYKSDGYLLNAVAFRRHFLLQNPIPTNIPLYRGNCTLHAYYLCQLKGYTIWQHPKARALHEPPTLSFSAWRYLLRGRDRVWRWQLKQRLATISDLTNASELAAGLNFTPRQKICGAVSTILRARPFNSKKITSVLQENPHRLISFPLAIPLILWFELLYTLGSVITYFQSDLLLKLYEKGAKQKHELSKSVSKTELEPSPATEASATRYVRTNLEK